jgi:hypothetical protein
LICSKHVSSITKDNGEVLAAKLLVYADEQDSNALTLI